MVSKRIGLIIGFLFSLFIIYGIIISVIDEANARFIAIAFGFTAVLFAAPLAERAKSPRTALLLWLLDIGLIAGFIYSGWWFYAVREDLWTGFYTATPMNVAAGIIGIAALLEMARRSWGWSLVILAICFFAFGFAGPYLPWIFTHFGVDLSNFMQIVWYSFDGVFGRITGLVANTVLIFLIFGAMLEKTGAADSLIKISTALTGRIRGGAAHAAIVSSAVFGMMSGSVAANIAGTGVFTIPMIKRQGFSPNFAAAVETAASSGGQLTPPIMAAAVFIMADLVGEPYLLIIAAASVPALFKYLSLFAQVYMEAVKLDLKPLKKDQLPKLTSRDWLNSLLVFLPIATLMTTFLLGFSPSMAGFVGVVTTIGIGLVLSPDFRNKPRLILEGLAEGGLSSAKIMIAVGAIGMVMAVINESGVAIRFATSISAFGDEQLIFALILAMLGALILGMGLPTLAAYLVIAIMIAPAVIKAGVPPIAAHMFVLYFAVYSSIVPPICYGCFVAAPIAGGNPFKTSFIALRISIVGLMVPYVFVYSPSLLLITEDYSHTELMFTMIRLVAAIIMFATSLAGADPSVGRLSYSQRVLRFIIGLTAMFPFAFAWVPASLVTAFIVVRGIRIKRKENLVVQTQNN